MSTTFIDTLTSGYSNTGAVTAGDPDGIPSDFYTFALTADTKLNFSLSGLESNTDADLYLYQVINAGATDEFYSPVSSSTLGGNSNESIDTILTAGDYTVGITPFYGSTNYTFQIDYLATPAVNADYSGWGIDATYGLGEIPLDQTPVTALPENTLSTTATSFDGSVGDFSDGYSFSIAAAATVTLDLTPSENSDVDLYLYDAENNFIAASKDGGNVSEHITADLAPGTYWVNTALYDGNLADSSTTEGDASYDLSISASGYTPPGSTFTPFDGDATSLSTAFNSGDGSVVIENSAYSGINAQAASVNNFAGSNNNGILLSTGSATDVLSHVYNERQGQSATDSTEIVNNWSNANGNTRSMQPNTAAGNAAGANQDVFDAVSNLVDAQGLTPITRVTDASSLSFDFTTTNDSINFNLMFGSEEFPLFANQYVDGATIMVDGVNYALFDTTNPETLLSVTQANVDAGFFHANTQLSDGTSVYPTEFNGISDLISVVAPLDTTLTSHHISISIADTNDHVLDSAVFVSNLHGIDLGREQFFDSTTNDGREGLFETIPGSTETNDVLVGGDGNDYSESGAGSDDIETNTGDDVVLADAGNDSVTAGDGNDYVDGGLGNDSIVSGTGDDDVVGGSGNDNVDSGDGRDDLFGDAGNDSVTAGGGDDTVDGGAGRDTLFGDAGNDAINGGAEADNVNGGAGNDNITDTGTTADVINGGAGNDTVNAGAGNDSIADTGTTADVINGGAGNDTVNAGAGNDTITDTGTTADVINGGAGNDTVNAGAGNDTITDTGTTADVINGGAGDDIVNAGAGNDTITDTGTTADVIDGGAGDDIVNAGAGNDAVNGGVGADNINGGAGTDIINGGAGADNLSGGLGADTFDYNLLAETTGDVINFNVNDCIDLSGLDANTQVAGNQAFDTFVQINDTASNTPDFSNAGDLFYDQDTDTLYGNTDADMAAEFVIQVTGVAGLNTGEFVL